MDIGTFDLCSGRAGSHAGGTTCVRNGRGRGARRLSGLLAGGLRPLSRFLLTPLLPALLTVSLLTVSAFAAGGSDRIINRAFLNVRGSSQVESTVAVTRDRVYPPPRLEILQYAPLSAQAEQININPTWYRTGSDSSAPFARMAAPVVAGSRNPLDLSAPIPLVAATILHKCDPIFIRLTDMGSDLDPLAADSALVTVSDPGTGEQEVLHLTETGPASGVFTGFIQSAGSTCGNNPPVGIYSGFLPVSDASEITAVFTSASGGESATSVAIVDPFGIVFSSLTGKPVDGGSITLIDAGTGNPAQVYGDDGISTFPSTITPGGAPTDSSGRRYDFPPGQFRFPYVKPGSYRYKVTPAAGYAAPSTASDAALQALPGGPFTVTTGSRLETFSVNPGPSVHIDVPVDPLPASLWLQKSAGKGMVAIGDFLSYQLDLQNNSDAASAINLTVSDTLPTGFRYRKGSTSVGGKKSGDPAISSDGRTLTFALKELQPKEGVSIRYVVEIAAGARVGDAVNSATAHSFRASSNTAQATVRVQSDFLDSRSIIAGRVERGPCNLDWDEGVEGIRIYLEDGTFVNTDKNGMFHFEGVKPGSHVLQLDLDSLPEGYQVYSCGDNDRFAGRSFSQFVDTQGGTLWRADFRVGRPDDVALYQKRVAEHAAAVARMAEEAKKREAERRIAQEKERLVAAARKAKELEEEEEVRETDDWATPATPAAPAAAEEEVEVQTPVDEWADPPVQPAGESPAQQILAARPSAQRRETASEAASATTTPAEPAPSPAPGAGSQGGGLNVPTGTASLSHAPAEAPAAAGAAGEGAKDEPRLTAEGILSPEDGSSLPDPISAVRVVVDARLTPQVLVDGVEVPADRIGFTLRDSKSGKTLFSYIGVDFGDPGPHTLKLIGKDPFGNVRLEKVAKITRVGGIATIRFVGAEGNVADGKTPVRLKLELFDAAGVRFTSPTELQVLGGNLRPLRKESLFPDASHDKVEKVQVDKEGYALFQPVHASGPYRAVLGAGKATVEAESYVQPKMRDWILVGLGEGTVGYNAVSGHMENLRSSGADEELYEEGRLAFYGKGTIQGKWLLTMAYDSARSRAGSGNGNGLFQTINPEAFYTLYGDATVQQYDAASAGKLYLKIEREQFYALFGDFDTNLTVTELSRYSRRMNGLKAEWMGKNLEANVFGSNTDQAYARDEIQGDGTSGLYHLSRKRIVANSERITIEVRDRFRSEIIISSRVLGRFSDYSIDYDAGTVYFKEPVYSRDEAFNPRFIVVEYEAIAPGGEAVTAGGRLGARFLDNRARAGLTYIHEGQVTGSGNSYGIDASMKLPGDMVVKGEAAQTESRFGADQRSGSAYLAELRKQSQNFQGRAYFREQQGGFGLGQQNGSETGTRKGGIDGSYKVNDRLTLAGQAYRQYNLTTGATQDIIEEKANFTSGPYSAHVGGRYASDTLGDGSRQVSNQVSIGGSWLTLNKRLTLRADHDQSLGKNDNASYPTRTSLGGDYKLTDKVTVTGQQEFTSGAGASTNSTRIGFISTPWSGGALNSSMQRDSNENGDRMFALFGLKQSWKITDKWSVDGGVDRSQTVSNSRDYSFNLNVPAASGSSEDFTAVSLGTSYVEKKWNWNNRVEYRTAESEDKWGVVSAFVGEPREGWGWSARLQVFNTDSEANGSSINDDLRLGMVYRPHQSRWMVLDRLDLIYNKQEPGSSKVESRRVVNNLNANYRPDSRTQLSLQYGAKYALETIDGDEYSGYTDLFGLEGRYDLTRAWDLGARLSVLHSWGAGEMNYSTGFSVGYNVVQNAWVSVGYNLTGFTDKDFSAADYTAQGPYIRFRFKFDQNSVKDAVKWINQ